MGFDDLTTKKDLDNAVQSMLSAFAKLVEPSLEKLNDRYLTVKEIAEFTKHSEVTVRKWMVEGKKDRFGYQVKLPYAEFSVGDFRALRSEVVKYGTLKDVEMTVKHKRTA